MSTALVVWLVGAMNLMVPAHREHFVAEAKESYAQADARYQEIATAILKVALDPAEQPLFPGKYGRERTALFLAAKMFHESGFRRDIQLGIGRQKYYREGLNDYGKSWCLGQINLGLRGNDSAAVTSEGWTGRELLEDMNKCAIASLHLLQRSFATCKGDNPDHRLAAYAAGTCESEQGKAISERRFRYFRRMWSKAKPMLIEQVAKLDGVLGG